MCTQFPYNQGEQAKEKETQVFLVIANIIHVLHTEQNKKMLGTRWNPRGYEIPKNTQRTVHKQL